MTIEENNVIFLLGAGCSCDAKIPSSNKMVELIEELIINDVDWKSFRPLYNYLRSSIQFADGIVGNFNAPFSIEKLMIVINDLQKLIVTDELDKTELNSVFPFIGAWDNMLLTLAGKNFKKLSDLKNKIRYELVNNWVKKDDYLEAEYYSGFNKLQFGEDGLGVNLKVFSLNYDLCFENVVGYERIESGFDDRREWSYHNFDRSGEKNFILYKLHGSLDWYIDTKTERLKRSDGVHTNPYLIFGERNKLQAIDPFLFYTQEFRRYCFHQDLKLIVCIGYSFADEHINKIIAQAVKTNGNVKILSVIYEDKPEERARIGHSIGIGLTSNDRMSFEAGSAKTFLTETLSKNYLASKMDPPSDILFD